MNLGDGIPMGWRRDADGVLRRETMHSMLRRLQGWDYRQRAIYQITITLEDRTSQALGRLEVKGHEGWVAVGAAKPLGLAPEAVEARVVPSAEGLAALAALETMPRLFPQVEIIACQLMPDHLHFIAFVKGQLPKPFGQLVRGFKAGAVKRWREMYAPNNGRAQNLPNNGRAPSLPENGRAPSLPENGRAPSLPNNGRAPSLPENGRAPSLGMPTSGSVPANSFAGIPAWAEGFQDTVLLHEGQLANMKRYLHDNPRRRAVKRLFPELFKVADEIVIPLDLSAGNGAATHAAVPAKGRFAALGNRFLLDRPLMQVQVSRRDFGYRREPKPGGGFKISRDAQGEPIVDFASPVYAGKKASLFAAARHGAVLISPCVSDGERQIAREALQAGMPLATMQNKGFARMQKPSGHYFDACAEGRLLMLAPAAWPYQPGEKAMTRFDATAMNRLCQWIVGEDAAEINYHGMQPGNIDALALAAAKVNREG